VDHHEDAPSGEEDPVAYELECVERVKEVLGGPGMGQTFAAIGRRFTGARTEGQFPNTRLIVDLRVDARRVVESHSYALWGELFVEDGRRIDPYAVAHSLATWLPEPLPLGHPEKGEVRETPPEPD